MVGVGGTGWHIICSCHPQHIDGCSKVCAKYVDWCDAKDRQEGARTGEKERQVVVVF